VGTPKKRQKRTVKRPTSRLTIPEYKKSFLTERDLNILKFGLKGQKGSGYFPPVTMLSLSDMEYLKRIKIGKIIKKIIIPIRIILTKLPLLCFFKP